MGLLDILMGREQPQAQNSLLNTARTGQAPAFPPAPAPYRGVPLLQELAQNGGQLQGSFPPAPAPYNGVPLTQELAQNSGQAAVQASRTLAQPSQPPLAQPQGAQGVQTQQPSTWDKFKNTITSKDFGDRLTEGLIGLGRGSNIAEGLTSGAAAMYDGNMGRREKNQTVDWLMKNGFSLEDAKAAASNPQIMQQIVSGQSKGLSPKEAVDLQIAQANLVLKQDEIRKAQNPQGYRTLTSDEKAQYGLPEDGVYQAGADGKIIPVSGANGANSGQPKLGLTPQYGVDENGNTVLLQLSDQGGAVAAQLPDGVKISKDPIRIDAGNEVILLDPITRQPVGQYSKNVGQTEAEKITGKAQGEALVAAPENLARVELGLANVDELINHPGLSGVTGRFNQYLPSGALDDNGRDALSRIDQLQGGVFLQGFQMLRGGGAITEIEGVKAQNAIARLNRAQSTESYITALKELRKLYAKGIEKYKKILAGQDSPYQTGETQPDVSGTQASNGLQIGQIIDGHEYLGGDPKQEQSWRQIK